MTNAWLGAIVDIAVAAGSGIDTRGVFSNAAAQVYSKEFESEADYEGAYFSARAGYDIGHSPEFWRRMGAEHPGAIKKNFMASHPSSPERFLRLDNAVKEINAKRADGRELVPEKASGK
jgi:predicted Zn-dependent protease